MLKFMKLKSKFIISKVERSIDDIMKNIEKLSNHLNAYKEIHNSLGKTIGTAVNHFKLI